MFKSIKLKIMQGRKLNPFKTASVIQDHEDRIAALEGNDSSDVDDVDASIEDNVQQTVTRNISFTVKDRIDEAVNGATVTIGSITGTTGSAGGCTLHDVEDGTQSVTVTKEGYVSKTESISVSSESTSFTIVLELDL